jgi:hypothetical protein
MGGPFFMMASTFRRQICILVLLSLFIASLEFAQLAIPGRHCDGWDVFWGCSGLVAAWAVGEVIKQALGRFRLNPNLKHNSVTRWKAPHPQ